MDTIESTANETVEQPRRRTDYVFGPALVPPSEWYYSYPLFALPDVPVMSYADEIARGAA